MLLVISGLVMMSSHGYVIPSPMDPTEQCIFTCDYCFQGLKLLQCANDCIVTEGMMDKQWLKTCPELYLSLYVEVDSEKMPRVTQTK